MNMHPHSGDKGKKEADRNVYSSECLMRLPALGAGWGLMPNTFMSQHDAGEWRAVHSPGAWTIPGRSLLLLETKGL